MPPWAFSRSRSGSARFGSRFGSFLGGSPSGRARAVSFLGLSAARTTAPCGSVVLAADALETSVQTFTAFGSKPYGLWSLTRPERSFLPSCRPLPMLGGFHVSRFARAATACRCRVLGFGIAPCVPSCHYVPSRPHSAILGFFVSPVSFRFRAERCKRYAKHRPAGAMSRRFFFSSKFA